MSLKSARDAILNTLNHLKSPEFREFCDRLTEPEEAPRIWGYEIEKNKKTKSRRQIMELLISRCEEDGALDRTVETLRAIGCNNEARILEESRSKLPSKAPKNPSDEREPSPAPKALRSRANREPKEPKKAKKAPPKAKKSAKLGETKLQFGKHVGKTFEWVMRKDRQYAVYLVGSHQSEIDEGKNIVFNKENKDALAEYVSPFPDAVEEVHFYREGVAPVGFGLYKSETRKDLYNSKEEEKKGYVKWVRSKEKTGEGDMMVAMIKYILYRDKMAAVSTDSKAGPQGKSSTLERAPPEPSSQPAAKKQRL